MFFVVVLLFLLLLFFVVVYCVCFCRFSCQGYIIPSPWYKGRGGLCVSLVCVGGGGHNYIITVNNMFPMQTTTVGRIESILTVALVAS